MVQHIGRWVLPLLALFLVGPLVGTLVGGLRASDGGPDVTLLVGVSPVWGLMVGIVCVAAAALVGLAGAKFVDERTGMLSAGLVLSWAAWRTGLVTRVLALDPAAWTLVKLAIEGAIIAGAALVLAALMHTISSKHGDGLARHGSPIKEIGSKAGLAGMAVGAFAALVIAHVVVFSPMRGQALLGAIIGGIAAGALGRLTSIALSDKPVSPLPIYTSVVLAAAIGPLIGLFAPGSDRLVGAIAAGTVPGPVMVQPLDWAAGLLVGVPIGLGWAAASVGKTQHAKSVGVR
ncbi:MAG: hypothetical protein KIT88_03390 [Phycisphaeraceae bacterium]|nr:hypothetical protein [Phycisphaeraceae bacterium]